MFCLARSPPARTRLIAASGALLLSPYEANPMNGRWSFRGGDCGKQRMDALRRRVSHGWLTEPKSSPRPGTTPTAGTKLVSCSMARLPDPGEEPEKSPAWAGLQEF